MKKFNYFFVVLFSMYLIMSPSYGMQFNSTTCPTCKPCDSSSAPIPKNIVVAVIGGCIGITLEKTTSCLSKGANSFWYACCKAPNPKKGQKDICHPCYKGCCQSSKRCLKMWCTCNKPSYVKYIQEEEENEIQTKKELGESRKNNQMNYGNSVDLLTSTEDKENIEKKKKLSKVSKKDNDFSINESSDD